MVNDKVVKQPICKHCKIAFDITEEDRAFYDKIAPTFAGKKYSIPDPTLCPDCRQQRRMNFRNERKLYHRPCSKTGKTVISMFSPDPAKDGAGKPYTVYATQERYADTRDARDYGRDVDFSQPFFSQFDALLRSVPQIALLSVGNENCEFNNFGGYSKNAYLCFDYGRLEDSSYTSRSYSIKHSFDISYCSDCEHSSNLSDCIGCVKCNFSKDLDHCYDCQFCYACNNCTSCYLCSNLVNKQYYIQNTPYSKEEYEEKIQALKDKPFAESYSDFVSLMQKTIRKYANIISCENVTGDYLKRCKNCREVYGATDTEDSTFVIDPMMVDNTYDDTFSGNHSSFNLEVIGCESLSHSYFCFSCRSGSSNLFYCHFCNACKNCFGCAGLRNKEYCILNKQYTKEEYEALVPKIIDHMKTTNERGEFFPAAISPFCYNETVVMEYYPLTKDEALAKGFKRMDTEYAPTVPAGTTLINVADLESLTDEEILKSAVVCEVTGRPFRITKSELEYYRTQKLHLPTKHPDQRHKERMSLRNPRKLRDRQCMKCSVAIKTSYSPEREEIIYCEECYSKELYG